VWPGFIWLTDQRGRNIDEQGNAFWGSIKGGEFLEFLKKDYPHGVSFWLEFKTNE
jgi:hypothetical protein